MLWAASRLPRGSTPPACRLCRLRSEATAAGGRHAHRNQEFFLEVVSITGNSTVENLGKRLERWCSHPPSSRSTPKKEPPRSPLIAKPIRKTLQQAERKTKQIHCAGCLQTSIRKPVDCV